MLEVIAVTGIFVFIVAFISEIRIMRERKEQAEVQTELHETISIKDNALVEKDKKIEELRVAMKQLASASTELVYHYEILAQLLEEEVGVEEAERRFLAKKNKAPEDFNNFIKSIQAKKEF